MLSEEKIKLMTSIAIFEKAEKRNLLLAKRYFKTDYIGQNLLRAFLGYTFCWILGLAVVVVCRIEEILSIVALEDVVLPFVDYGVWYLLGLAAYLIITFVVCYRRYGYAERGMKVYVARLKRLNRRYEFRSRTKEHGKEGRRS